MHSLSKPAEPVQYPVSSAVLAVIMVIIVELMFFGGLISSFIIAQTGQVEWPPADQPRLPFWMTFSNMWILLILGLFMFMFVRRLKKGIVKIQLLNLTLVFGTVFFIFQGFEWFRILLFGIQAKPSLFASYFYTLIALHGLHVLAGLLILVYLRNKIRKVSVQNFYPYALAGGIFWFFVVLLWPVLYALIYV